MHVAAKRLHNYNQLLGKYVLYQVQKPKLSYAHMPMHIAYATVLSWLILFVQILT